MPAAPAAKFDRQAIQRALGQGLLRLFQGKAPHVQVPFVSSLIGSMALSAKLLPAPGKGIGPLLVLTTYKDGKFLEEFTFQWDPAQGMAEWVSKRDSPNGPLFLPLEDKTAPGTLHDLRAKHAELVLRLVQNGFRMSPLPK